MNTRGLLPPLDTPRLSPSERRILALASTMSDAEISAQLGITVKVVRNIMYNVRLKARDAATMAALKGALKGAPSIKPRARW